MADIGFAQYIVILYTCCCLEMATKEGNNALAQCDFKSTLELGIRVKYRYTQVSLVEELDVKK